jgi:hypothetical protein
MVQGIPSIGYTHLAGPAETSWSRPRQDDSEDGELGVSVIICAYTEQRWEQIRAAVESVFEQHPGPAQMLLVVDHNADLAERARREFSRVTVLESDAPPGLSGARNAGLRAATQPITAFLDDDAVARPGWLASLVEPYSHSSVVATGGSVHPWWPDVRPSWLPPAFDWVVGCSYLGLPDSVGPVRNPIGANMSLRTHLALDVGGFDASVGRVGNRLRGCEETELAIRLVASRPKSAVFYVPAAAVDHHVGKERLRFSYFLRRCWQEGQSKATVVRLAGSSAGLERERRHLTTVIPAALFGDLGNLITGHPTSLLRMTATIVGLAVTAAGYSVGRAHQAGHSRIRALSSTRPAAVARLRGLHESSTTNALDWIHDEPVGRNSDKPQAGKRLVAVTVRSTDSPCVLYVAGLPRSGSTVLGYVLGGLPSAIFVGELAFFWRRFAESELCSCSKPLPDCHFWSAVVQNAFGQMSIEQARELNRLERRVIRRQWLLGLTPVRWSTRRSQRINIMLEERDRLCRSICEIANAELIIDSGKEVIFGAIMTRLNSGSFHAVHLVRDPRGVAFSWQKQVRSDSEPADMPRSPAIKTAARWIFTNLLTQLSLKRLSSTYQRLRYEELVARPDDIARQIWDTVSGPSGSAGWAGHEAQHASQHHLVGSNPGVRRHLGGELRLTLDEEWQVQLPRTQQRLVVAVCSALMAAYGYPLHRRRH